MNNTLKVITGAILILLVGVIGYSLAQKSPSLGSSTGYDSLKLTPSASTGDTYGIQINGVTTQDINGNTVSPILQTNPFGVNIMLGTSILNNVVLYGAGFSNIITTSTTLTPAQFCASTDLQVTGTTGTITITVPAATSTFAACNGVVGGMGLQTIVNDSTNTVLLAGGTGVTYKYQTLGVGSTTYAIATSTGVSSSSVVSIDGIYDTSSSLYVLVGPQYR